MHEMAEAPKIRLVRCPNCGNLLSELPDYSVYECGGCGTVLRAKKKASTSDEFLEKSNKEKNVEGYTNLETQSEKVSGGSASLSKIERESDGVELCSRKDGALVEGNVNLVSVSSSRAEEKQVLIGHEVINAREENKGLRLSQSNSKTEIRNIDKRSQSQKYPTDSLAGGDDQDTNLNKSKSVNSSVVKGIEDVTAQSKNSAEVMKSRVVVDKSGVKRVGFWGFDEDSGAILGHPRFSPLAYPDEGPSNSMPNSVCGYGKPMKNFGDLGRPNTVENLELNRPELLRKLNELKEKIHRLEEKPRETIPNDKKMSLPEYYGGHAALNVSMQPFAWGNDIQKPPNFNHSRGPAPLMNDHNLYMHNFYPRPRHAPDMIPGSNYGDPFLSQMLRRPPSQPSLRYRQQVPREYFSGQYMDFNHDLLVPHSREPFLHQPACSCLRCPDKNWQVPPEVPGTGFSNRRIAKDPMRSNSYHHTNPIKFCPKNYDPIGVVPPSLHPQDPQPHTRWPIDIDSDVESVYHSRLKRVVVASMNRRLSRPIAGGAPFVTCCNCLELLKLPRKLMTMANNLQKIQCGKCSTVHSIEIKNKRLIISRAIETVRISAKADDDSCDRINGGIKSYGCSNAGGMNYCSVDFDSSGYNFQSADTKRNFLLEDQMLNLSESQKRQGSTSSSSVSTEEEKSPDSVIVQRDISNSSALQSKHDISLTIAGSNFDDDLNDSSSIHAMSSTGKGNRSKRLDQEKVTLNNVASQQNVEKDTSTEIEVEVSFNEYLSQDSVEVSRDEDKPRIKKGHKTFLVGLIKKSFRDFSRSNQNRENERANVLVNGQHIPSHLVKKAEKLAGPIEPGDYWYDFRTGFWGVMGQPCLGIVMPFIEEFNYPMSDSCAAGNTGVFVNGRELHQVDLDLLASRGLPITRKKNYIIEFSGRVVDEDSGEEIDNLGKLAPTVENKKRGFGMRVPKVAL